MSTNTEKVEAQKGVFFRRPMIEWQDHLIGPVELERLLDDSKKLRKHQAIMSIMTTLTSTAPTKEGWYWVSVNDGEPQAMNIKRFARIGLMITLPGMPTMRLSEAMSGYSLRFAGPIPVPKE